ncbi:MAG: hypothetical protein OIF57_13780 [Marinobacterium sp.]|nr:hypothetical protein [Marinobacterium sp.]
MLQHKRIRFPNTSLCKPFYLLPALVLTGCLASNPLQIPDEEWAMMNTSQRQSAYEKQAELDKARAIRQAEQARWQRKQDALQAAQAAEQAQQQAWRLEQRRQSAVYGEVVQCVVEQAALWARKIWRPMSPFSFEVMAGERLELPLQAKDRRYHKQISVSLDRSGQRLQLCSDYSDHCNTMVATTRELKQGRRQEIGLNSTVRGMMRCDLKPLPRYRY